MSALDAARDHYLARFEDFRAALGGEADWLGQLRADALASFGERGLPHTRLEEWRYTNLAPLAKIPFEIGSGAAAEVSRETLESLAFPLFACSLYVFINGRYAPVFSAPISPPGSSHVDTLAALRAQAPERLEPHLGRYAAHKESAFAALNTAFLDDGIFVYAPRSTRVNRPIHVVFLSTASERPFATHPRLLVVAEEGSNLTVIQDHVTLGDAPGFTNALTEVYAGAGSQVNLVTIQREHEDHFHVSNLYARQERDAHFTSNTLTLGGALVRNDAAALMADEGAECTLNGLFIAGGDQLVDNHTVVDHAVPHCSSSELYKGVLGGHARGVFRGRVIVRPDAQKTNASQSNPNLLLSSKAEMNTKPQLEIYADDVKCSHGTSIGQLDADALFYLRSRGLGEERARDLLTRAFALELLDALPVAGLGEGLDDVVLERLRKARRGGEKK
jgi:Fe-S cluster assembly protein SufD